MSQTVLNICSTCGTRCETEPEFKFSDIRSNENPFRMSSNGGPDRSNSLWSTFGLAQLGMAPGVCVSAVLLVSDQPGAED